jgi:hypothetical protein
MREASFYGGSVPMRPLWGLESKMDLRKAAGDGMMPAFAE